MHYVDSSIVFQEWGCFAHSYLRTFMYRCAVKTSKGKTSKGKISKRINVERENVEVEKCRRQCSLELSFAAILYAFDIFLFQCSFLRHFSTSMFFFSIFFPFDIFPRLEQNFDIFLSIFFLSTFFLSIFLRPTHVSTWLTFFN